MWLYYEIIGFWFNEGCYYLNMKNCKGKFKKVWKLIWLDVDWSKRMCKCFKKCKKGLDESWDEEDVFFGDFQEFKSLYGVIEYNFVVINGDVKYVFDVLVEFVFMEKSFIFYLRDFDSWEFVGEGDDNIEWVIEFSEVKDCGCE